MASGPPSPHLTHLRSGGLARRRSMPDVSLAAKYFPRGGGRPLLGRGEGRETQAARRFFASRFPLQPLCLPVNVSVRGGQVVLNSLHAPLRLRIHRQTDAQALPHKHAALANTQMAALGAAAACGWQMHSPSVARCESMCPAVADVAGSCGPHRGRAITTRCTETPSLLSRCRTQALARRNVAGSSCATVSMRALSRYGSGRSVRDHASLYGF